MVWLTSLYEGRRAAALADWIIAGGPASDRVPEADLPVPLIEAVAGLGPPVRLPHPAR